MSDEGKAGAKCPPKGSSVSRPHPRREPARGTPKPKDEGGAPPAGGGRNRERDFHGERRRNDTPSSTTDPDDARLFRKGHGKEARLGHTGHVLMANRHGLSVDALVTPASGAAERDAAVAARPVATGPPSGADKGYDRPASLRPCAR